MGQRKVFIIADFLKKKGRYGLLSFGWFPSNVSLFPLFHVPLLFESLCSIISSIFEGLIRINSCMLIISNWFFFLKLFLVIQAMKLMLNWISTLNDLSPKHFSTASTVAPKFVPFVYRVVPYKQFKRALIPTSCLSFFPFIPILKRFYWDPSTDLI